MATQPNIILLFPDQHRGHVIGCNGDPAIKTPNIDRIASEGVTFNHCYTSSPLCIPARASLATGQRINEHGTWYTKPLTPGSVPSHVRSVRDVGYHTAVIGKTHLFKNKNFKHLREADPVLREWGYVTSFEAGGVGASPGSFYADHLAKEGLLEAQLEYSRTYSRAGGQEYRLGEREYRIYPWEVPPCILPTEDHKDMYTARTSAEWIRNYRDDKPFYLQVCFNGPHNPFDSPSEYRAMYRPEDMPLAILDAPAPPVAPYVAFRARYSLGNMTECHNRVMKTYYYGKVSLIDTGVGLVLKALEEKGLLDNTWIIYSSDHGECLGDHRISGKLVFYEGAINIPCIIRPPKGMKGWKSAGLTDTLDLTSTITDIAGVKDFAVSGGRSLVSQVLAGVTSPKAQVGKEAVLSEVDEYSMIRTERYKMAIHALTREPAELYDLHNDPQELRNRVNDPAMQKVRNELLERHFKPLLGNLDETKFRAFQKAKSEKKANEQGEE